MRISFDETSRGAEINILTLAVVIERVVAARPGTRRDAVIETTLTRLARAVDEIAQAIREPGSAGGSQLRGDLAAQLEWLVHAGHIDEVAAEDGEARYVSTRSQARRSHRDGRGT